MATLVDSHVHLDRYSDEEVTAMVARGAAAGVRCLLTIGVDLATSRAALRLAGRHPEILAAVGIHPARLEGPTPRPPLHRNGEGEQALTPTLSQREREPLPLPCARGMMSAQPIFAPRSGLGGRGFLADLRSLLDQKPAAVGEVGLDESAPDLEGQQRFLAACVDLAHEYELPLVLHVVGAPAIHEAALQIVGQHPSVRAVAHYFVGGPDLARRYVEAGCWISVGRPVTRPGETAVRTAIPTVPLDRLLLETDTYPLPGRTTEPCDVAAVCAAVAELRGQTYEEIAAATTANFDEFIAGQQTSLEQA